MKWELGFSQARIEDVVAWSRMFALFAIALVENVSDRIVHRDILLEILDRIFVARSAHDWLADLEAAGVPASPLNDIRSALDNPQIRHRGMVGTVDRGVDGDLQILHNPIRMSATPIGEYAPPPRLGEHSDAVLHDVLGYDAASIEALRAAGAI